jgi:hypothetical protein
VKFSNLLFRRLPWLNLPGALLVAVLQRVPAIKVASNAESALVASSVGAVLRSALATVASLGAVHALAGATAFVVSRPNPIAGTVGTAFTPLYFTYTGTPAQPLSFRVVGTLPPGLSFVPAPTTAGYVNATTPFITGTPTTAGSYTVRVQGYNNLNGTGETNNELMPLEFTITGAATVPPNITQQPGAQSVRVGESVTFTVAATSSPAASYQWRRNGVNIVGASEASLTLTNVQLAQAGDYSVVVSNTAGNVTSATAALIVTATPSGTARLSNLSVRTTMAAGQTLIVGVVVNDGSRDILVRAAGPALAAFGLTSAMSDPLLELYSGTSMVLTNNDWAASLAPMFASVGAFSFTDGSKDAAFVRGLNAAYSIQARGTGAGVVLVEAYDTGPTTPARLVNVSARNRAGTGDDILIAGFTISGTGAKQLLIRAVGPTLAVFGVGGVLQDPKLEIFDGTGVKVTENDTWSPALATSFASVGAFELDNGSRDAALIAILPAGSYTAQVRGSDGGTGEALIEIYELP